jgi:hypothetical protein
MRYSGPPGGFRVREIPIIRFSYPCYRCGKNVYITWPFNEELTSPESLSLVGEVLRKKEYSSLQVVNSQYTFICRNCGTQQGNFYLKTEAMHEASIREPYDYIEMGKQE